MNSNSKPAVRVKIRPPVSTAPASATVIEQNLFDSDDDLPSVPQNNTAPTPEPMDIESDYNGAASTASPVQEQSSVGRNSGSLPKVRIKVTSTGSNPGARQQQSPQPVAQQQEHEQEQEQEQDQQQPSVDAGSVEDVEDEMLFDEEEDEEEDILIDDVDEDEDDDDDFETPREAKVDVSKMTRRQRLKYQQTHGSSASVTASSRGSQIGADGIDENGDDSELMDLDIMPGAQDKRRSQLTTEQRDLRKAELLRRRKIQLKQKSERERQEVIDRLLNKQPSKKSDATETATAAADEGVNEMEIEPTPAVASIRFTSSREGNFVFVSSDAIHLLNQLNQPPMSPQSAAVPKCSVQGCTVAPKYKLKDGVSRACSLDHYKLISV